MKRICFVLKVRPECLEEYRQRHRAVWPEMRAALSESGWRDYTLFLREDGLLVGYLVTEDFAHALAAMQSLEVNTRWQTEMAPYFESNGLRADQQMHALEEIFHLE